VAPSSVTSVSLSSSTRVAVVVAVVVGGGVAVDCCDRDACGATMEATCDSCSPNTSGATVFSLRNRSAVSLSSEDDIFG
jgi:hypothetical protein